MSNYHNGLFLTLLLTTPLLAGCVSDEDGYGQPSIYYRDFNGTPASRDRAREAWQRQEARRDEITRRQDADDRQASDHHRFCRSAPSSLFCRYD